MTLGGRLEVGPSYFIFIFLVSCPCIAGALRSILSSSFPVYALHMLKMLKNPVPPLANAPDQVPGPKFPESDRTYLLVYANNFLSMGQANQCFFPSPIFGDPKRPDLA